MLSDEQFWNTEFEDRTDLWQRTLDESDPIREEEESLNNHASSLFKLFACPRRYYWDRMDPIEEDRDWRLTAAHGDAIHDMVADIIKMAGRSRGEEVRGGVRHVNLSYRIDNLFWDGENVVPVEVKSANNRNYERFVKQPNRSHVLQLQSYLHFHKPEPYPYGYLLYYNKDADEVCFLKMHYNPELGKAIEARLLDLEEHIAYRTVPRPTDDTYECRWCPYKERCRQHSQTPTTVEADTPSCTT